MNPDAAAPRVTVTVAHHDPHGRLAAQMQRVIPYLQKIFGGIAVAATHAAAPADLDLWRSVGALVEQEPSTQAVPVTRVGQTRRAALQAGLHTSADYVMYCDSDRLLHWAEFHPQELARIASSIPEHDLTVLGRTPRAFGSHPQTQRDTEILINRTFALVSGMTWDTGAAARGLSRRAAEELLEHCPDQNISTDVSWPLHLLRKGGFSCAYFETEGLEFETADRFGEDIQALGGKEAWLAALDQDPREWALRLELAHLEVQAILQYL